MGKLRERQSEFAKAVSVLILFATSIGYEITFGDAYRDPRVFGISGKKKGYGSANSQHKKRLAIDLNLFKNGVYLGNNNDHNILHDYWELMGGAPRLKNDLNHYMFK